MTQNLLTAEEPPSFVVDNPSGRSPFLLVCEHGGDRLPKALGDLGLDAEARRKHFALDIGALALARGIAEKLDSPLAHQPYSRLVCDCNRRPEVESFIPAAGEGLPIPGNLDLAQDQRDRRRDSIWRPFHEGLAQLLEQRQIEGRATLLVSIHSFTPVFFGEARPWQLAVLYDRNQDLSPALLAVLRARFGAAVGDNQPYRMSRDEDYTIPMHGDARGLPSAEIEVRNDLLAKTEEQARLADLLAQSLEEAAAACDLPDPALLG